MNPVSTTKTLKQTLMFMKSTPPPLAMTQGQSSPYKSMAGQLEPYWILVQNEVAWTWTLMKSSGSTAWTLVSCPPSKGATGHDMLTRGITTFDFTINEHTFTNSFIVCTKVSRPIILGRDFTIPNAITVGQTRHGTKKLCTDDKLVLEMEENFEGKILALSRSIHIPPRCTAVTKVTCLSKMDGKLQV